MEFKPVPRLSTNYATFMSSIPSCIWLPQALCWSLCCQAYLHSESEGWDRCLCTRSVMKSFYALMKNVCLLRPIATRHQNLLCQSWFMTNSLRDKKFGNNIDVDPRRVWRHFPIVYDVRGTLVPHKNNARVCGQWEVVDFRSITGEKQIIQLW